MVVKNDYSVKILVKGYQKTVAKEEVIAYLKRIAKVLAQNSGSYPRNFNFKLIKK